MNDVANIGNVRGRALVGVNEHPLRRAQSAGPLGRRSDLKIITVNSQDLALKQALAQCDTGQRQLVVFSQTNNYNYTQTNHSNTEKKEDSKNIGHPIKITFVKLALCTAFLYTSFQSEHEYAKMPFRYMVEQKLLQQNYFVIPTEVIGSLCLYFFLGQRFFDYSRDLIYAISVQTLKILKLA